MSVESTGEARKLPRQVPFIIGNEACERFSFYGMRNILTAFLVGYLLLDVPDGAREASAKDVFHVFVMGVYFFPLLGGWIADRYWGKYRTIFWLSLLYCAGHLCLATFESHRPGFYTGLFLIALGSGGIKPCVSSFVGDQFDQSNKGLAKVVFDAFYWIINFGSFFASLFIPLALKRFGPAVAFGIPGALMFIATLVFWLGRKLYVNVPARPRDPHSFGRVCWTALHADPAGTGRPGLALFWTGVVGAFASLALFLATRPGAIHPTDLVAALCLGLVVFMGFASAGIWKQLERARGLHPDEDVDGARAVFPVLMVFALITPFWSLFDQKASTWILQARAMTLPGWGWFQSASQMQALNPLLVMMLIPINNLVFFPLLRRFGIEPTPMRRMATGIAFSGLSWIVVGAFQLSIDAGGAPSILWQILPYALLTFGEVLVSATGLEFAYSQAPGKLKGVLMSFWGLGTTVGNLWVLLANAAVKNDAVTAAVTGTGLSVTAFQMFFFAGFALVAALAFALYARRYVMMDFYRRA